jgi:uncharacterized membrane protein YbhN (UPF0104 family)
MAGRTSHGAQLPVRTRRGTLDTYDAHKTDVEARQGSRRLDNFWVLIISTGVLIAAFAIIYFIFFAAATPPSVISP